MKTKTILLVGAVSAVALLPRADAALSFSLSDSIGNPSSVTLAPGTSFSLKLEITSTLELLTGLSYNLEAFGLASSQFRITGRALGSSPFSDLTTSDSIALEANSALLDPRNNADLGATLADVFSPVGPGTFLVADYTIIALPTIAPGQIYSIGTATGVASNDAFEDRPVSNATYSIVVVPEPGTALFGLFCLGALSSIRRRSSIARG